MAGHGDAVAWEDLPAKEQQRIAQRQEKKQQARMEYYKGAVKWGVIMGTVGVAGHFAGNKFWPVYRRLYYVAKCGIVTSFGAAGWWAGGERSFQQWHRREFDEMANAKRRALMHIKSRARQARAADTSTGSGSAAAGQQPAPSRSSTPLPSGVVAPNVDLGASAPVKTERLP